jgi:hypothetical protein
MSLDDSVLVRAILACDRTQFDTLLSGDPVFHSPVRSYAKRADVVHLLSMIGALIPNAQVVRTLHRDGGRASVIRSEQDEGVLDAIIEEQLDEDGRVREVTLMLRPVSVMMPMIKRMGAALDADPLPSMVS